MTIKMTLKNDFSQGIISDTLLSQITDNQIIVNNMARNKIKRKIITTDEIKRLKKELKEWQSQDVKERFESVNSRLHIVTIKQLRQKIKQLKSGEDI